MCTVVRNFLFNSSTTSLSGDHFITVFDRSEIFRDTVRIKSRRFMIMENNYNQCYLGNIES